MHKCRYDMVTSNQFNADRHTRGSCREYTSPRHSWLGFSPSTCGKSYLKPMIDSLFSNSLQGKYEAFWTASRMRPRDEVLFCLRQDTPTLLAHPLRCHHMVFDLLSQRELSSRMQFVSTFPVAVRHTSDSQISLVVILEIKGISPEATDPFLGRDNFSGLSPVQKAPKRLRIRWQHFVQLFCIIVVWIPTLEFFLNQNPQPDDSQGEWSFGQVRWIMNSWFLCHTLTYLLQILALISVIPCVVSVILEISKVAQGEIVEECNCKAGRPAASQTGGGNSDAETEQIERM